jgi:hypothetical protein
LVDGEEHADPFEGEVGVAFVDVDADGVAAHTGGDGEGGAGPDEGVEDAAGTPPSITGTFAIQAEVVVAV